ncbi:biopolymer transport protein ExbD/TolR [Acinetobacter haemolyticus]|nr:biopolymer transport protein ExbD/TolR [Acinetobacter haemolyticus]
MGKMINSDQSDDDVIGTINTTPLVDIMLVLLIIFLITVPVVTHTVPVNLPEEKNAPYATTP